MPDLARRGGGRAPSLSGRADAECEIDRVEALGARYLVLGQGLYPRLLAEMDDAPPLRQGQFALSQVWQSRRR